MQQTGVLRVVSAEALASQEREAQSRRAAAAAGASGTVETNLRAHVRTRFEIMRRHRESSGLDRRLLDALRTFNGEYSEDVSREIDKFGGSHVFARLTASKARGATALLRDIYFSADKPWGLKATDVPTLPGDISSAITRVVQAQVQAAAAQGQPIPPDAVSEMISKLMDEANRAAVKKAAEEAKDAEARLNDILEEGGFYSALSQAITDIPLFPFATVKGPFVRMARVVKYENGAPAAVDTPKLFWSRVSPFDIYFMPGVSDIRDSDICERMRWTRKDLNDLLGLPGWNDTAIKGALDAYDNGLREWMVASDAQRAVQEDRENPTWNQSSMIDAMEFHGNVKGSTLLQYGMASKIIEDSARDYFVQAWIVGDFVLKVQLSPSPRQRHPYAMSSFEKVPGTPVGHALPDMLKDVQDVANAAMRALVNNMAMASGPQVMVMTNRMSPDEDPTEMYPWKRWMMQDDPMAPPTTKDPISFFQPRSNASELLGIYQKMTEIADEVSAIPRYITGSGAPGGAGRTASGLSMLMANATKVLQQVAHNIDTGIIQETLTTLYELVMVADAGVTLRGDESIVINGVTRIAAREVERARQLEFLSLTANPMDMQIVGLEGRAAILREIATGLGLPGDVAVPTDGEMQARQAQALDAQSKQAQAQATGDGNAPPAPGKPMGPVTNVVQPGFSTGGLR